MDLNAIHMEETDTERQLLHYGFAALLACTIGLTMVPDARAQSAATATEAPSAATAASRQREKALNPQPLPPIDKPGARAKALN
ncbi:MAG TPA: hypothetical protein PLR35_06265, partial [Burkholderiaceae bacterium]|nr:hypothetical protein [Burkholderiaceae bacterium]